MTNNSAPTAKSVYLSELDGVRAASILLVLGAHMLPLGPTELKLNSMAGLMGMSLFFCLSGFLITRFLYERPEIGTFLSRRIARIYPLVIVYGLIIAIALGPWRWDSFAAISLFYLNYNDSAFIAGTGHLWSLCVEFHFYVSIAIAVLLFKKKAFWLLPIGVLLVLLFRIEAESYASIRTHMRVDEILVGGVLALIWLNREKKFAIYFISIVSRSFWLILPLWMLSSHEIGGDLNYFRPLLAMMLVGSILFMEEGWIRQLTRWSVLAYIAKISYALYIWHMMTMLGWLGEGERWELYLVKRPLSFALTFALAHLSTHTLEKYFTDLVKKHVSSKQSIKDPGVAST